MNISEYRKLSVQERDAEILTISKEIFVAKFLKNSPDVPQKNIKFLKKKLAQLHTLQKESRL